MKTKMRPKHLLSFFITVNIFLLTTNVFSQNADSYFDLSRFDDSAHHWYDIIDADQEIKPLADRPRYSKEDYRKIADNILLFQKSNGGWAKNYDMCAILNEDQIKILSGKKMSENTTFDNGATHSQLSFLAEVFTVTNENKYKEAFMRGLNFVLNAQYENGGWPQSYPDTSGYKKYITFNDGAMTGIMNMFQKIAHSGSEYKFINKSMMMKINKAYEKGIDCILKCQIVENGKKLVWCQQHDNITLRPSEARTFEKASLCNAESSEIVKLLMRINKPSSEVIDAVESAVAWFRESEIHGIKLEWIKSTEEHFIYHSTNYDRIVVKDPEAPRIWARFYELGTHRPIFTGRDGVIKYSMEKIDRDRRTGYAWYIYNPEEVYELYPEWSLKNKP